jgi:hypothetical protein
MRLIFAPAKRIRIHASTNANTTFSRQVNARLPTIRGFFDRNLRRKPRCSACRSSKLLRRLHRQNQRVGRISVAKSANVTKRRVTPFG